MNDFSEGRPRRGRYEDPDSQAGEKRAIILLDIMAAVVLANLTDEQYDMVEQVAVCGRSITEASQILGIPRMTANDRLNAAYAQIRRVVRNDPAAQLLFSAFGVEPK